jgi:hypothetical protein
MLPARSIEALLQAVILVDAAGRTAAVIEAHTASLQPTRLFLGEIMPMRIFVAVLRAASFTGACPRAGQRPDPWAEAVWSQKLPEETRIVRLEAELLGDALHVIYVAGKPRFEIVEPREEHGFGHGSSDDLLASRERCLEHARQILLDPQRRAKLGGVQIRSTTIADANRCYRHYC